MCLVSSRRDIVTWHGSGCGRMGTQLMLPPRHLIQAHPHGLLFHGNSCLCWFSISVTERRKPSASTRDRFVLTGGSGVLVQRFSACVPRPLSQESRIRYPAYQMFPLQFTTVQSDSYKVATKRCYGRGPHDMRNCIKGPRIEKVEDHCSSSRPLGPVASVARQNIKAAVCGGRCSLHRDQEEKKGKRKGQGPSVPTEDTAPWERLASSPPPQAPLLPNSR